MKKFLQDKLRTFLIALCARLKRRLFLKSKNAGYVNLGRNLIAQLAQEAMLMLESAAKQKIEACHNQRECREKYVLHTCNNSTFVPTFNHS